ncbi:MAG TPA: GDP-L-fucose synthase [Allocoleopsis sp.]
MDINSKIAVIGHRGMVGSAILRKLNECGYKNVINSGDIDLRVQEDVKDWFIKNRPKFVFLVAGKVGGIMANNTYRAEFIYDNILIEANVIHQAHRYSVEKLLFVGSSCIYPVDCPKPIREEYLLSGSLEPTNEPYAIAKIAGIKMCENYKKQYRDNFISAIPTNSYGINDKYHLQNSHVLPSLLRRVISAKKRGIKELDIWGTGRPRREFIYVDDMADALVFLMKNYNDETTINVGTGQDISIKGLAELIKEVVGWDGVFVFNGLMDGMFEKRLDVSKINNMGWHAKTTLYDGISKTIEHIYEHKLDENW